MKTSKTLQIIGTAKKFILGTVSFGALGACLLVILKFVCDVTMSTVGESCIPAALHYSSTVLMGFYFRRTYFQ